MSSSHTRTSTPPQFEVDRVGAWLAQEVDWPNGLTLQDTRLHRAWAGRHGRIAFELALSCGRSGSTETHFLQGIFADGKFPSNPRRTASLSKHGLASIRVANQELGVWCCTPDCDAKLPIVAELLAEPACWMAKPACWLDGRAGLPDDGGIASVLRSTAAAQQAGPTSAVLGLTDDNVELDCVIKGYRASRRCVLRVSRKRPASRSESGGAVFIKAYRRAPGKNLTGVMANLASYLNAKSRGRVRIPAILDDDRSKRLLITTAVAGDPVASDLDGDDLATAAGALAMLHTADIRQAGSAVNVSIPPHTPADDFQTVYRWVHGLSALGEARHLRLRDLTAELSGALDNIDPEGMTLVHRDFYTAQLLRDEKTLWLVDFDTLSIGHPELDVATFVAHLWLDELCAGKAGLLDGKAGLPAGQACADVSDRGRRFIGCYQSAGGKINPQRIHYYLACAAARLGAMHLVRGVPAEAVEALWTLAEQNLSGAWNME